MNVELTPKTWTRIASIALLGAAYGDDEKVPRAELVMLLMDGPRALRDAMESHLLNVTPFYDGVGALFMMIGVSVNDEPLLSPSRWEWFAAAKDVMLDLTERERAELFAAADFLDNIVDFDVPDHPPDDG